VLNLKYINAQVDVKKRKPTPDHVEESISPITSASVNSSSSSHSEIVSDNENNDKRSISDTKDNDIEEGDDDDEEDDDDNFKFRETKFFIHKMLPIYLLNKSRYTLSKTGNLIKHL